MRVVIVIIPVTYLTEIRPLNDSNFTRNHFCYLVVLRSSWSEIALVIRRKHCAYIDVCENRFDIYYSRSDVERTVRRIRSLHFAASDTTNPRASSPHTSYTPIPRADWSNRWINYAKSLVDGQTCESTDEIIELNEWRLRKCFVRSSVFRIVRTDF